MRRTQTTRLTARRGGLPVVGALGAAVILAACGGSGPTAAAEPEGEVAAVDLASQSLTVSNWEGYMPEDLPATFEEEVGPEVTVTNHATNEEIVAKLTAGADSGIDVAFVSGQFAQALAEQGLLAPIDREQVPNLDNLSPEATDLPYDPGNESSVPYTWGTTGICYRSDLVDQAPTSWDALLSPAPEHEGKVTMMATERWLMLPAQKALGFSANTQDEAEMEQVKELLVDAKGTLLAYDDTTFYERLVSGEAVMVQAWDGWCNYGIAENPDIEFVVPEEGSDLWVDTMVVLESSENKEAAFAFINYILQPENHAWAVENILYNVPNQAAMDMVPAALFEQYPPLGLSAEDLQEGEALVDLGDAATTYTQLATEITASGG